MRIAFLIPTLALLAVPAAALAQEPTATPASQPSAETIRCQLDPSCIKKHRSLEPEGSIAQPKQNVANLNVSFEYNSAVLQTDAYITLDNLGRALSNPSLAGYSFEVSGHTDRKGSAAYNQVLSERRAQAVRDYLVSHYNIPTSRLATKGYGSIQLLNPKDPYDGVNRRVQIVNMTVPSAKN
jgi:outer membrane protein OmpA-like peptidoglycan-associated protein